MTIKFIFTFLGLIFLLNSNQLNAQNVSDNSAFKLPPSILKTLEKKLNTCLSSGELCDVLQSVSKLDKEELDYYFSDFSNDASSNYNQLASFGDNVVNTIYSFKEKIEYLTIEEVTFRYGHSKKVRLADLSIYFHHKDRADIVNATFLIGKDNEIYSVMLSN